MRGPKLVAELERKLGVHLGSLVSVPLNNADGTPRQCQAGKARACVRKNCPKGYVRYLYMHSGREGGTRLKMFIIKHSFSLSNTLS